MAEMEKMAAKMVRTSAGLRDVIFDELDGLRQGTTNPTKANAVAKLAMTVVETVRMEIEVAKHADSLAKRQPDSPKPALGGPIDLGGTKAA